MGVGWKDDWLLSRMKYAYIRSAKAIFNTSFTTVVAFCSTGVSPIMPIWTFGVYAAICVVMNYLFVLTLYPATLIVHEKVILPFWREKCVCCLRLPCFTEHKEDEPGSDAPPTESTEVAAQEADDTDPWFVEQYIKLVENKVAAGGMVTILTAWMILSAVLASQLEPPVDQEQWLPKTHMTSRGMERNQNDYYSLDDQTYAQISFVWGMKDIDRSDYEQFFPNENRGEVVWDSGFDLFDSDTQDVLYDVCDRLPEWSCTAGKCDYGLLVRPNTTVCFLTHFDRWMNQKGISTSDLITDGSDTSRTTYMNNLEKFRASEYPLNDYTQSYEEIIGFVDGDLKYVKIRATMSMPTITPLKNKEPIYARADKFLKTIETPSTAKYVFQWTLDWNWNASERGFVDGLTQGMAIALPLAFIVLVFATRNFIISAFAILNVGGVIASTLGLCKMQGWALGIGESIAGVIVIGLSVDYAIHLGHMYDHAGHEQGESKRDKRFEYAARKMVYTVLGGAI